MPSLRRPPAPRPKGRHRLPAPARPPPTTQVRVRPPPVPVARAPPPVPRVPAPLARRPALPAPCPALPAPCLVPPAPLRPRRPSPARRPCRPSPPPRRAVSPPRRPRRRPPRHRVTRPPGHPRRRHSPRRPPQAQIAARINPVGTLSQGATGIVGFSVDNTGSGPAATVTANVSLPLGVSLLAGGTLGRAGLHQSSPGGWTCAPGGGGATCTHGPLAADASTTSYLQVVVAADAPPGQPPAISVDGGGRRATARGTAGVTTGGFPARFAAS